MIEAPSGGNDFKQRASSVEDTPSNNASFSLSMITTINNGSSFALLSSLKRCEMEGNLFALERSTVDTVFV